MGFLILGIGSIRETGLNEAILQIISHGFIGAALFFLAGTSYDRLCLLDLDEMGGMAIPMPKIFTIFTTLSMWCHGRKRKIKIKYENIKQWGMLKNIT